MARLLVVYDPSGELQLPPADILGRRGGKAAMLDVADGLKDADVYAVSKRLADLLLEQLSVEEELARYVEKSKGVLIP